ncbi:MAG: aminotransferase class I/II-fold pyridoxal phosphate-dependent enzyme [Chloroflexi bacterium]|nr:aminotransferase class I/II-fold pyridoxal phosphate-dependent enzyme [Chloroflexota bacterium]
MNLNRQFELIRQSPTVEMGDRVNALKAAGRKIIGLQTGDPDFPTHPLILGVALKAMQSGLTHYAPSRGLLELRRAASTKLERDNAASYDPEAELLITHGGIHAYYLAMQSVLNSGDEVLIPDPTWATHVNMAIMLRGSVIRVPALPENGFIPTFEAWEKALTPKTRVIVLNYPSNPTGAYPTREYLKKLHDFAAAHKLWIVSDEVYENLYYGEKPISAAAFEGVKERTILVNSLSKTYAMTGWRVGYLAAPAQIIENALKAGQNSITCVAPFIQKAAAFALTAPEIQQAAGDMRAAYARRRQAVLNVALKAGESPVIANPPMGAFYYFHDLRALKMSSLEICERLLEEAGVGLVPGSAFGMQGDGFVRMTIAASEQDVEAGMRAILNWADRQ